MSGRRILVDRLPDSARTAVAVLERGRLEDLLIDPPEGDATPIPGEIYPARIDRLVPKMGAAFVRLAGGASGFLRDGRGLGEGAEMPVQVVSYPEPGKARPVTLRLLHKGAYVIRTPGAPGVNISRQIREAGERARLTAIVEAALAEAACEAGETAAGEGCIVRSAAEGVDEQAIREEVSALGKRASPGARARDRIGWAVAEARRELLHPVPDRIHVHDGIRHLLGGRGWECRLPDDLDRLVETGAGHPFEDHGVWEEIERLRSPRAALTGGASMAVEPTAALVAVDVNTGGNFGGGDALSANLAAARELARQLRLRGLGGQVVVDFAPVAKRDRKRVEDALRTAFRRDPVETSLAGWTTLGLFELQRKRERRPLADLL